MSAGLKTTGQLRTFLADLLVGIKNGHVDLDKASRITQMAAQINESFYSEIKIAAINSELGNPQSDLGQLLIGEKVIEE